MTFEELEKEFISYAEQCSELLTQLVARVEVLEQAVGCRNMKFMEPCRICKWCVAEQAREGQETKDEDMPDGGSE